jgi:hypothetical protein
VSKEVGCVQLQMWREAVTGGLGGGIEGWGDATDDWGWEGWEQRSGGSRACVEFVCVKM